MKASELRSRSNNELSKTVHDERERLGSLRFDLSSGKIKNVSQIRKIKKDIARISTLLNERKRENIK